jgi:hypothetical protein
MRENYYQVMGWEVPVGTFPCWIISESDRLLALQNKKPFHDYSPSCYFKLTKQLDNDLLEGHLGHSDYNGAFHENISSNFTYLDEYQKRIPVYLSFDRVSLYRIIAIHSSKPLTFILKRIDSPKILNKNVAFMIMPFRYPELNQFYQQHIKGYLAEEMNIQVLRADDFSGNDIIIDTIYNQIDIAEFVVVDTSYENKNAFYEFGYAAAKEKEIITIQNTDIEKLLFFDRVHIRAILYSLENIAAFKKQLKNSVEAIREKLAAKN